MRSEYGTAGYDNVSSGAYGTKEKVTVEMVRKKAEDSIQEGLITPQRFQKDTKEILKILKKEKIILNEQEQKKYDDCISTLKNLLCEKES